MFSFITRLFPKSHNKSDHISGMNIVADLSITPHGTGTSCSAELKSCLNILRQYRLNPNVHAFGTNIEGDWNTIIEAVRECQSRLHESGIKKVTTRLELSTKIGEDQSLGKRLAAV